jgi:hypothetical protein
MTETILVVYSSFLPSTKQIASNRNQDIAMGRLHAGIFLFDFVMPIGIEISIPSRKRPSKAISNCFSSRKWKFLKSPLYCHSLENYFCGRKGDRKKTGEMRVRPRFFVDGCTQNSRLLRRFKFLGMKNLARVVIHRADSTGPLLSPPVFFGLIGKGDIRGQVRFVADLFNVAA